MKTNKLWMLGLALMAISFSACKSNQEAYNAAYERAKAQQEAAQQVASQPKQEVIEVVEKPSIKEASENIEIIGKSNEKGNYGVVIGSFINRTNAEGLQKRMIEQGYSPCVLGQNDKLMYRVIVAFYEVKSDAQAKVRDLAKEFPDAWILIKE
ncbi:MAG: SPOR domain-containing protein [Bacteroidales bacterium]|nr:SPOR domain-containing protein [Bacteroidales bacterium]